MSLVLSNNYNAQWNFFKLITTQCKLIKRQCSYIITIITSALHEVHQFKPGRNQIWFLFSCFLFSFKRVSFNTDKDERRKQNLLYMRILVLTLQHIL